MKIKFILIFTPILLLINNSLADEKFELGKDIFLNVGNCSSCHSLKDAGSVANVGPNLNDIRPDIGRVVISVTNGAGVMPSYLGILSDDEIEAGTVVHFVGEGKLAQCDTENCSTVAGIISTDPAYLMNSDQEGVALAISGRVPCKVTGAVAAGDLMVSAGNGRAMANNSPAIGTVIGKAIEAHEGGDGVIEVLATMM